MAKKVLKQWEVGYKRTCRGIAIVAAETASEARDLVDGGDFDPAPGEATVDWESTGPARESK